MRPRAASEKPLTALTYVRMPSGTPSSPEGPPATLSNARHAFDIAERVGVGKHDLQAVPSQGSEAKTVAAHEISDGADAPHGVIERWHGENEIARGVGGGAGADGVEFEQCTANRPPLELAKDASDDAVGRSDGIRNQARRSDEGDDVGTAIARRRRCADEFRAYAASHREEHDATHGVSKAPSACHGYAEGAFTGPHQSAESPQPARPHLARAGLAAQSRRAETGARSGSLLSARGRTRFLRAELGARPTRGFAGRAVRPTSTPRRAPPALRTAPE